MYVRTYVQELLFITHDCMKYVCMHVRIMQVCYMRVHTSMGVEQLAMLIQKHYIVHMYVSTCMYYNYSTYVLHTYVHTPYSTYVLHT